MLLPHAGEANIAPEKLRDYLLNPDHPNNGGKARFFAALGYDQTNWQQLEADIRQQHLTQEATEVMPTQWARRFKIEALLVGLTGQARVRTTWAIVFDTEVPILTSAYGVKSG